MRKIIGCANKHYQKDLLLIEKKFLEDWFTKNDKDFPANFTDPYEIKVMKEDEDYEIETDVEFVKIVNNGNSEDSFKKNINCGIFHIC